MDMKRQKEAVETATAGRRFHQQVLAQLGDVMRLRGLRLLGGGPGNCATLFGERCWLRLWLDKDGEVACTLNDPSLGGEFELVLYLHLTLREGVTAYLPAYRDCGCENVTTGCLAAIAASLSDRALDAPFGGDFSWARDYWLLREEAFTVGEELLPVLGRGGGFLREWRRMVGAGDPGWILEGRKVVEIRDAVDER